MVRPLVKWSTIQKIPTLPMVDHLQWSTISAQWSTILPNGYQLVGPIGNHFANGRPFNGRRFAKWSTIKWLGFLCRPLKWSTILIVVDSKMVDHFAKWSTIGQKVDHWSDQLVTIWSTNGRPLWSTIFQRSDHFPMVDHFRSMVDHFDQMVTKMVTNW